MINISLQEILKATNGTISNECKIDDVVVNSVCVNSKEIKENSLFVPIVGEKIDAHSFIQSAFESGASASLCSKKDIHSKGKPIVIVDDTKKALQDLAKYYRKKFDIPVIGVTGSVGKTSTKEMIYKALSNEYNVLKTYANQNSQIGLPLTVFNIDYSYDVAVIEMGMSKFGEMSRLSEIARPTCATISNIGISHIENLHTIDNILTEKLHITDAMDKNSNMYVNGDDKMLFPLVDKLERKVVTFGTGSNCDYRATDIKIDSEGTSFNINLDDKSYEVKINAVGKHNVYNALCAIAVGKDLRVPVDSLIDGISKYSSPKMRQEIHEINGYKVIDDSYNASPDSMKSGIDVLLATSKKGKKILVCADMLELGEYAKTAHYDLGVYAANSGVTDIVAIGELSKNIIDGAISTNSSIKAVNCGDNAKAIQYLKSIICKNDTVLIKGSRGMKTDEIVKSIV